MSIHRNTKEITEFPQTPIQESFANAVILISGGTGFLGKVLIEKLLWSFPDIKKIYMIVRPKKNKKPEERLEEIFESKIFIRIKKVKPNFREYISIIYGDFEQAGLGLSEEQINIIKSEVNIVFHTAATVKFDEKMRLAAIINIQGTQHMLELSKKMKNLKAFVHVSTAYSHSNTLALDEKFYESPRDPEELIQYINSKTDEELDALTPEIIGEWPNTYTYTKSLAEEMIRKNMKDLPIVMVRPSIVVGSWRDPYAGWIDNIYGPTGIILGVAYGIIHVIVLDRNKITDIMPVDMVVNGMIASAWEKISHKDKSDEIFHFVTGARNPIRWGQFIDTTAIFGQVMPVPDSIWYPSTFIVKSKFMTLLLFIIFHYIPGILIDALLKIKGDKPKMMNIYKKYIIVAKMLRHFTLNEWEFTDTKTLTLWNKMTDRDREIFPFNVEDIKWNDALYNNCKEMRETFLNLSDTTLMPSRKRYNRLRILHFTLYHVFWIIAIYFIYRMFF